MSAANQSLRVGVLLEQLLAPVPGGTGRYSGELAAALARTRAGVDVVYGWTAWHRDVHAATVAEVVGPYRLPLPRRPLTAAWERGVGPVPHYADVVHAPTVLSPPRAGYRLVVTVHDAVPWTLPQTLTPRGVSFHRRMIERAVTHADAITVPTEAVRAQLCQHVEGFTELVTAGRVAVHHPGVAPSLRRAPSAHSTAQVSERYRLPATFLLSLATLEPRKGLDILLEALAHDPSLPPLLVVGSPGWGGVDVAAAQRRLGLAADRVRVLGHVCDRDLAVILRAATLLAMPSRGEGFGLPVAEAMAVGTPVVCSDDPALREVAAQAAVVVAGADVPAWANALAETVDDLQLRERLSREGVLRAQHFDWDRTAEQAWQLYRSLL